MPGPLKWIMELYDRVSGPAEKMSKAAEHFEKSMERAGKSTERMAHAQKELSAERIAVMTEVVREAAEGIEELTFKLFEMGLEFGKETLKAADFERTNSIIFESLAGSSEKGERIIERAKDYAQNAGITIAESMGIFRTLMTGNVKDIGSNYEILAQAAGDMALKTGTSAQSIIEHFAEIQSRGQLNGLALRSFAGAIPLDLLAKKLGVASGSFHELQEMLNKNPVSAQRGIQAILDTLAETEGGVLGKIRKGVGEGFEGMTKRISNSWENLLGTFAKTQAFTDILNIMDRIAKALDPTTESGKRIEETFTRLAKAVEEFLNPLTTKDGLEGAISRMERFGSAVITVVEAMARLVTISGRVIHALSEGGVNERVKEISKSNSESWFNGGLIGEWWRDRGTKNAQEMVKGFSGPEGIDAHSPSKVFERLGGYSAQGFNDGYLDRRDDALSVPSSTRAPGAGSASSTTGHNLQLHQEFVIHGGGMNVEELAQRIAEISATSLQSPLESLALSMGTM